MLAKIKLEEKRKNSPSGGEMPIINVRMPWWMVNAIDDLIDAGVFVSRAEAIRFSIRLMLKTFKDVLGKKELSDEERILARLRVLRE